MTVSTMAALKSAIKAAIAADTDLAGVQVYYGDPGDKGRRECIWLGASSLGEQEHPAMKAGKKRRREDYDLTVIIEVMSKRTPEASEARAVLLCGEVEDLLAADTTVGSVPNLLWAYVSDMEMNTTEGVDGPRSVIDLTIRAVADLL